MKLKENHWRGKNRQDIYLYSCKEEADLMFMLEDFLLSKSAAKDNGVVQRKHPAAHCICVLKNFDWTAHQ